MESNNSSQPKLALFPDPSLQSLYTNIAAYMSCLPNDSKVIKEQIGVCLSNLNSRLSMLDEVNVRGYTLFLEILMLETKDETKLAKLEEIFAIFMTKLSVSKWAHFVLNGLKANFLYIRARYYHSFFINRLWELVNYQHISKEMRKDLANFFSINNFKNLADALDKGLPVKASAAIDLVFQQKLYLNEIIQAFEEAKNEQVAFIDLFLKIDLKAFKAKLDAFPGFSQHFFTISILNFKDSGKNLLEKSIELKRRDLVDFLMQNCHIANSAKYNLQSLEEKTEESNPKFVDLQLRASLVDENDIFLCFVFIYLEQMKIELSKFHIMFEKSERKSIHEEQAILELRSLVFDLVKDNQYREMLVLDPENLWKDIKSLNKDKHPYFKKLIILKKIFKDGFLDSNLYEAFPSFQWNFFITFHIQSFRILQKYPNKNLQVSSTETTDSMFTKLLQALSKSFLKVRQSSHQEQFFHDIILQFASQISQDLQCHKLGYIRETVECGMNVVTYLFLRQGVQSESTKFIWTEIAASTENIESLVEAVSRVISSYIKKYPKSIQNFQIVRLSPVSFSLSIAINESQINWGFSSCPFNDLLVEPIFPFACLTYDLEKRTIYNPIDSTSIEKLFEPFETTKECWQDWAKDVDKLVYVIETLAIYYNFFKPKQKSLVLADYLSSALMRIKDNQISNQDNALIKLFSKKTFSLAQFHLLIIEYELGCIFDLASADSSYLRHLYSLCESIDRCENYEYLAVILHHVYRVDGLSGKTKEDRKAKIISTASKFLESDLVVKIMPLIESIESELKIKEDLPNSLVYIFDLKSFYKLNIKKESNPYRFMPQPRPQPIESKQISSAEVKSFSFKDVATLFAGNRTGSREQVRVPHKSEHLSVTTHFEK